MSLAHWHIPSSEEEVVEIFFEEVGELLETIDTHMKTWRGNVDDKLALSNIRRCFHTLKGSGRMVKALDVADLAWRVENMLNQAIAGAVPASISMVKLVASVRAKIPRMIDAMKNGYSAAKNNDIGNLMKTADALAAGKSPTPVPAFMPIPGAKDKLQPIKPSEVNLKLERFMQRADEALHRSEMALQQARRTSTQIETLHVALIQQDCRAGVNRIEERLNLLFNEAQDARLGTQRNEIDRLVNKQVSARFAPTQLLIHEIKQEIEQNRRKENTLSRLRWLVLISSATIGGMITTGLVMWIPLFR